MLAWLESIAGPAYATAMMWTLGALLLLVVILLLIKVIRSLSFGTFVSGGRNRKTRLAVMDATAVDSHRRLVLVRRDDVEHLILIGGTTDVVVEQNIRLAPALRRPADENVQPREVRLPPDAHAMKPAAESAPDSPSIPVAAAPAPRPASPQPVLPQAPPRPSPAPNYPRPVPMATPMPPAEKATQPASAPTAPAATSSSPAPTQARFEPSPRPAPAPTPRAVNDQPASLDDTLLEELEVTLDRNAEAQTETGGALPSSVEDEMSKLLGDLARPRR